MFQAKQRSLTHEGRHAAEMTEIISELKLLRKLCWSFLLPSPPPSSLLGMEVGDPFKSPPPPTTLPFFSFCLCFTLGREALLWWFMTSWTLFPLLASNTAPHTYKPAVRILPKLWAPRNPHTALCHQCSVWIALKLRWSVEVYIENFNTFK